MIDRLLSTRVGKFLQIFFAVYVAIWGLAEPLNLTWITCHPNGWRFVLILSALFIAILRLIDVVGRNLEMIDAETTGKTLLDYASYGNPSCNIVADGQVGKVMTIKGEYDKDELDWNIKPGAQKAGKLIFKFSQKKLFYFYLRVAVKSKSGGAILPKWIRFDNTMVAPEEYQLNKDEMGCPYENDTEEKDGLQVATIDIKEYVAKTYGLGGWEFEKLMIFRVRTYEGLIKSITFKK